MHIYKTSDLFDLSKTIAASLLEQTHEPWQVLPGLNEYILGLIKNIDKDVFIEIGENVWAAKTAKIAPSASINGPCIIDSGAEIRHCAFIRGSAIVGKNAVIGNSTELKNVLIFDNAQVPHFNYVGDSILGYKTHFGAGVITANVKSDSSLVSIKLGDEKTQTKLKKLGTLAGDFAEVGCNSVLAPGCVLGRHSTVYPTSFVRGTLLQNSILKKDGSVVQKKDT